MSLFKQTIYLISIIILSNIYSISASCNKISSNNDSINFKNIVALKIVPFAFCNASVESFHFLNDYGIYYRVDIPFAKKEVNTISESSNLRNRIEYRLSIGIAKKRTPFFLGKKGKITVPSIELIKFRYVAGYWKLINYGNGYVSSYSYQKKSGYGINILTNFYFFSFTKGLVIFSNNISLGIRYNFVDDFYNYSTGGYSPSPFTHIGNNGKISPFIRFGINLGFKY